MYEYVDPALIKQLRDLTWMPLMKCRKALLENGCDLYRAKLALYHEYRYSSTFVLDGDRPFDLHRRANERQVPE
jgi:hypothetical protein